MAVAMTYGVVYQSVGYLMKLLEKICHVDGLKKAEISVVPDYTLAGIVFDCDLTFRVSLGNLVGALLKAGFAFLKGYIKIKPDPDHPETAVPVPDIPHAPKIPLPVIPSPPSPPKAIGSEKPPDAPLPPVM